MLSKCLVQYDFFLENLKTFPSLMRTHFVSFCICLFICLFQEIACKCACLFDCLCTRACLSVYVCVRVCVCASSLQIMNIGTIWCFANAFTTIYYGITTSQAPSNFPSTLRTKEESFQMRQKGKWLLAFCDLFRPLILIFI